ncbi:hypothetical protein QNM99_17650 [Pseudomonas sp. PCH446]
MPQSALAKYRLPEHSTAPSTAYNLVRDELLLDGNSRQNWRPFAPPGSSRKSNS